MKLFKDNLNLRNACLIGTMCFLSYLAVYIARNALGVVSPEMVEGGTFTTEQIGTLSSIYFITYASGQLINGAIGDKITAKFMISLGLCLAGVCNIVFTRLSGAPLLSYIVYGFVGFFLSMIYGPMTKLVSENTTPIHATRCSLGYTMASFLGSPAAGVFATVMAWQGVFNICSATLILMGLACFVVFSVFEKKGIIRYHQFDRPKGQGGGVKVLLRRQIIKFTFISALTGIVRTTVVFWLPTYYSQHLGFSNEKSALLFTVSTLIISLSAFVSIFLYERAFHRNMNRTILASFLLAAVSFSLVYLLHQPVLNMIFIVLAVFSSNSAATMLWSRYCPSLLDTGMVSSATGYLDFMSYVAASISSTVFANALSVIGWGGLILVWLGLMVLGIVVSLPFDRFVKRSPPQAV